MSAMDHDNETFIYPGHAGPGLWVRIQEHFGPRLSEWSMSLHTLLWGMVLLLPGVNIFGDATFRIFRAIFGSPGLLGAVLILLGSARLIGLTINGMRRQVTPWVRLVSAMGGFWVWGGLSTCFALSGVVDMWLAIYPVFIVVEVINMRRASIDAGNNHGTA